MCNESPDAGVKEEWSTCVVYRAMQAVGVLGGLMLCIGLELVTTAQPPRGVARVARAIFEQKHSDNSEWQKDH